MKKLFISQPMNGKTNEEILSVREKAIEAAEAQIGEPVEALESFFQDAPHEAAPLQTTVSRIWNRRRSKNLA